MRKRLMMAGSILAGLAAVPVAAAIVPVTSYETQQPDNGTFTCQDDSYNGTNTAGFLSGGTGDLTNGIIAAASPTPWSWLPAAFPSRRAGPC